MLSRELLPFCANTAGREVVRYKHRLPMHAFKGKNKSRCSSGSGMHKVWIIRVRLLLQQKAMHASECTCMSATSLHCYGTYHEHVACQLHIIEQYLVNRVSTMGVRTMGVQRKENMNSLRGRTLRACICTNARTAAMIPHEEPLHKNHVLPAPKSWAAARCASLHTHAPHQPPGKWLQFRPK